MKQMAMLRDARHVAALAPLRLLRMLVLVTLCLSLCLAGGARALEEAEADADQAAYEAAYEAAFHQYILRRMDMLAEKGPSVNWSMEDKAALDDMMRKAGYWDIHHIVPGPEDVSQEAAIEAGNRAILDTYEIAPEVLDTYSVFTDFYLLGADTEDEWRLWILQYESPLESEELDAYRVQIISPSGEIETCLWYPGETFGLQESQQQSAAEFSEIPPPGLAVSEKEAVRIAREAVLREFGASDGITEKRLGAFVLSVWLQEDGNLWQVELQNIDAEVQDALGSYMVLISPKTGDVHSVEHGGNG